MAAVSNWGDNSGYHIFLSLLDENPWLDWIQYQREDLIMSDDLVVGAFLFK